MAVCFTVEGVNTASVFLCEWFACSLARVACVRCLARVSGDLIRVMAVSMDLMHANVHDPRGGVPSHTPSHIRTPIHPRTWTPLCTGHPHALIHLPLVQGAWKCPDCPWVEHGHHVACMMCGSAKPSASAAPAVVPYQVPGCIHKGTGRIPLLGGLRVQ